MIPRPLTVVLALLLAAGTVGRIDMEIEAIEPSPAPAIRVLTVYDPINPPRCPKFNVDGHPLKGEIAMKADRGPWTHACEYDNERKS